MAKNDRLLIDGIIDDRIAAHLPSDKRDEAFEYFAFEQILKDHDLSRDEILHGVVDGRQDGGIDGFFILVNGHLLQDPESFVWPRSSSELRLVVVTCKHHDTFRQATLDALVATLTEILDFAIDDSELSGAYSVALLQMRNNLRYAYRKLSPRLSSFLISVSYASRGDSRELGEEVRARGRHIASIVEESFGSCRAEFSFVGATELVELHRRNPNYTLELPFVEALSKGERYVVLVRLSDYHSFISDQGKLRRYLFDSNVRDFMGLNRVNEDIKTTLENPESPDFWWLNNGVTILATSAAITGKSIQVSDVQIVNGLQTTESIFRHFSGSGATSDERCLMVKVVVTKDDAIRDAIIRATNNQTDVELASLHATDKIQRDIEDVMLRHGLFYERRKNHYANLGHAHADLVTPLYIAAGYVGLILKAPHKAATLRSKFMRSPEAYEAVFNSASPLDVWPKLARVLKRVDSELEALRPQGRSTEKFLKSLRYLTALLVLAKHFRRFTYTPKDLLTFDVSSITPNVVMNIWQVLQEQESPNVRMSGWTSFGNVMRACEAIARAENIEGVKTLLANRDCLSGFALGSSGSATSITGEFVSRVAASLPPQPWKPGIHRKISTQLNCDSSAFRAAVEQLIEDGAFLRQKDGVLFDRDGNVVSFDPDRVDPETLELRTREGE